MGLIRCSAQVYLTLPLVSFHVGRANDREEGDKEKKLVFLTHFVLTEFSLSDSIEGKLTTERNN